MKKSPDIVSGLTHLGGAVLSLLGLISLVYVAYTYGSIWHVVSFTIFGVSLICLYTASSLYHLIPATPRISQTLRKLDHMMIFVLIAGTYTPLCLVPLRGAWGWSLLVSIWGISVIGIVLKIFWLQAPRWLYTGFYLFMGWLVVIATGPLIKTMPQGGLLWFALGGLFYTVGAVFYGTKWPKLKPGVFGFHELWHLFVLAGSASHFWAIYRYVSRIG
ncbi:MAG: hemolysin III family protein [Bacillota bacterium]|nr:hemolysin III family protein [Bacillota bacterium]